MKTHLGKVEKMATQTQIETGKKLGLDVSKDSDGVASAWIESSVFEAVYPNAEKRKATEKQLKFLCDLGISTEIEDFFVISALISDELQKTNADAINELRLKAGDKIVCLEFGDEKEDIISSIGSNLRVWFKGGNGRGCWPSKIVRKL